MLISPNTVLGNSVQEITDLVFPHIQLRKPSQIKLVLGTQVNGNPHFGTHMVHAITFKLAQLLQREFSIETLVHIGFLDNTTHETVQTHYGVYQRNINQVQTIREIENILRTNYGGLHQDFSHQTDVVSEVELYSIQQRRSTFRSAFIKSLSHHEVLAALFGGKEMKLTLRVPCPKCGFFEKKPLHTRIVSVLGDYATIESRCFRHGKYTEKVEVSCSEQSYIDVNVLHRNLLKEQVLMEEDDVLSIVMKGADWYVGTQIVDQAHCFVGSKIPLRIFAPTFISSTGCKLSKSLIKSQPDAFVGIPDWITDATLLKNVCKDPSNFLLWLAEVFLVDQKHFFRDYSASEIERLLGIYQMYINNK